MGRERCSDRIFVKGLDYRPDIVELDWIHLLMQALHQPKRGFYDPFKTCHWP